MYNIPAYPASQKKLKEQSCRPGVLPRTVFKVGRDFCKETSMHGFAHIATPGRHWFERILWACITAAAIWGAVEISLGQWQRFNDNPTVVTLEKDFRSWRFSLPSVTACYTDRVKQSKLPSTIKKYWNIEPDHEKYNYYSRFVNVVANSDIFNLNGYEEFKDDESLNVDLYQLAIDVMPDSLAKATWSDSSETIWTLVMTETGLCYNTNSVAITDVAITQPNPNDTKLFPLGCKYSALACYVIFEVQANCDFFFHSSYDVMDLSGPVSRVVLTLNKVSTLSVMETRSGRGVKQLSPRRRGCLYTDEPALEDRKVYSTNTCRLNCRSRLAIKLCGCKPFYYFYDEGPTCTPAGMACLSKHAAALRNNGGARCVCAQQCIDAQYKELFTDDQYWPKGPFASRGSVRYTIQAPRTRYTREIVFYFQDLVVSFGGAAGLFIGASFISFVEIFYFVISRCLGLIIKEPKNDVIIVQKQKITIPYETRKIMEITSILERQKQYDYRPPKVMNLYY